MFQIIPGEPYGALNAVALRSLNDGTYFGANKGGTNADGCGGEVSAYKSDPPPHDYPGWAGWWILQGETSAPVPGKDFWNTVGGFVQIIGEKVLNNLTAADIASLIKSLAGIGVAG